MSAGTVTEGLAEACGEVGRSRVFGREVPRVDPVDEEGVRDALRLAAEENWTLLPLGTGSKIGWTRSDCGADFVLGTRGISGIVAYEPGDGTITARAGTTMAELAALVAADGFELSPRVPCPREATLGGVIAAGQSGCDRPRTGPVRHHVLGARVALAEGTIVRSGGRLVKNVTGYDLHRLHCGAFGTLGLLTEISLRLLPAPEERRLFEVRIAAGIEDLLSTAKGLRAQRLTTMESLRLVEAGGARLMITLSGLGSQVADDAKAVRDAALPAECIEVVEPENALAELRDAPASDGGPLLHATMPPSLLERSVRELRSFAETAELAAGFFVEAETAAVDVFAPGARTQAAEEFVHRAERALRSTPGARAHFLNLPAALRGRIEPFGAPRGAEWTKRLKHALDPEGRFGVGRLWPLHS